MFAKVANFFVVQPIYVDIRFQKRHFLFKVKKYAKEILKKVLDGGVGMNEVQTSSAALHI